MKTIEHGDLEIEIDGWGGVHFDFSECDDITEMMSLSPPVIEDIIETRDVVLKEQQQSDQTENTDGN